VAKRRGQRIRDILRLRWSVEAELSCHHALHLRLVGVPIPGGGFLDTGRRVLVNLEPGHLSRQDHDSPRFSDLQHTLEVLAVKDLLDRQDLRLVPSNHLPYLPKDGLQPLTQG
jgi:hypothetical protein